MDSFYTYVYDLPYVARAKLCSILNQNGKWEELAGIHMKYDVFMIQNLQKEFNPTDELLTVWGHLNHKIIELFILLSQMQHYQSMILLKPFVESKYHVLLHNGECNFKHFDDSDTKYLQIGKQNFNKQNKTSRLQKIIDNSSLESRKILNLAADLKVEDSLTDSINLLTPLPEMFSSVLPCILYNELAVATNYWKKDNILGRGGFGTVFKGLWKNTKVAIKKIVPRSSDYDESYALQLEQSFREIKILNSLPHDNILPLYAYSIDGETPCLVYQCMIHGSLEDRLHLKSGTAPLKWLQRKVIAKGTARGLQYLHTIHHKPLIHGDIKSANILLDRNFEPKIGDFGLAREGLINDSLKVSKIQGTRPYLPEEYIIGKNLSTKIDTYSYGIVLFELATGLHAYDKTRPTNKHLKEYIDSFNEENIYILRDKGAGKNFNDVFTYLIKLGKWCSNKLAGNRPEMRVLYEKFKK